MGPLKRAAALAAVAAYPFARGSYKTLATIDRALAYGEALGLHESEIAEVLRAWHQHNSETGQDLQLQRLQASLRAYSSGEEWRP